ncbi:MAG TPA: hypothetical protein VE972_07905 [Conexibacter sp.]|nr:hypothetical protein [Conexibacter sp.]
MSRLDILDWIDLASFSLTRVDAFDHSRELAVEEFARWRALNMPAWRDPPRAAATILTLAEHEVRPGAFGFLRRAADGLLESTDVGRRLPADWASNTAVRWRLPLGTIQAAALASEPDVLPSGYLRAAIDEELQMLLDAAQVVDGHVHAGAILPFEALLRLLIANAPCSNDERGDVFIDSSCAEYLPLQVLQCATVLEAVLNRGEATALERTMRAAGFDEQLIDAVGSGRTWQFLAASAPTSLTGEPRWMDIRGLMPEGYSITIEDPHVEALQLKTSWLRSAFNEAADPAWRTAVEDFVRCEAVLHHALTQGSRAGLDEFLDSTERLRTMRQRANGGKHTILRNGLRHLCEGVPLKALELRTSEQPPPGMSLSMTGLAESLDVQFGGYLAYVPAHGTPRPVVAWPICLIRSMKQLPCPDGSPAFAVTGTPVRFDFRDLWSTVVAAADLLSTYPTLRSLVPGLDGAGDENSLPSWCIAQLFREFAGRIRGAPAVECAGLPALSYRIHAGESYGSPVQGLRRIHEAITHVIPSGAVPRIGHGLVLANPNWGMRCTTRPMRRDEAFDDLVWAWHLLRERGGSADGRRLAQVLAEVIVDVGRELYPALEDELQPDDYFRAYEARFQPKALEQLGLLEPAIASRTSGRSLRTTVNAPANDVTSRLLYRYLTDTTLSTELAEPLVEPVRLRQVYYQLRGSIVDLVRERGAVIESCPTSNLVIDGIEGYGDHPLFTLAREQVGCTINTDDPGIFSTSILDEYALMWEALGATGTPPRNDLFRGVLARGWELFNWCPDGGSCEQAVTAVRQEWRAASLAQ